MTLAICPYCNFLCRTRARFDSLSQGTDFLLGHMVWGGAIWSKILVHVDIKEESNWSPSTFTCKPSLSKFNATMSINIVQKSSTVLEFNFQCLEGNTCEVSLRQRREICLTALWSENPLSIISRSETIKPYKRTRSNVWPCMCVGPFTYCPRLCESMRLTKSRLSWTADMDVKIPYDQKSIILQH